jgi:hypothetical protein
MNNKIFIFGGGATPCVGISDTVEVFSPLEGTVENLMSMQYARAALASATLEDKIYVMGGRMFDNSISNIVEEYTPNGQITCDQVVTKPPQNTPKIQKAAISNLPA